MSHFSYHDSRGEYLLCDLQGGLCDEGDHEICVLTDPVVMFFGGDEYGQTDLGEDGMKLFFARHKCGEYCERGWDKPSTEWTDSTLKLWNRLEEKRKRKYAERRQHPMYTLGYGDREYDYQGYSNQSSTGRQSRGRSLSRVREPLSPYSGQSKRISQSAGGARFEYTRPIPNEAPLQYTRRIPQGIGLYNIVDVKPRATDIYNDRSARSRGSLSSGGNVALSADYYDNNDRSSSSWGSSSSRARVFSAGESMSSMSSLGSSQFSGHSQAQSRHRRWY